MKNSVKRYDALLIVILASVILILSCILPVSAATIDITLTGNINNMQLTPGIANLNTSAIKLTVTTTGTTDPWTVSVNDASNDGKPETLAGCMVEYYDSGYVSSPKNLTNMSVLGYGGNGYGPTSITNTSSEIQLSALNQIIETGTGDGTWSNIPIAITQPVSLSDPHLTGGHVYRIIVTFTGAAP